MRAFLLVVIVTAACASTPVAPPPRPAVLRVLNGTASPADVFVEGYLLAVAPPRGVRSLPHLPGGALEVSVVARDGSARASRRVVLEPGRDVLFELSPASPATGPTPPPGLGALSLANPHDAPLELFLDGEPLGSLFERSTRRFDDLPAGPHALLLTGPEGVVLARLDLLLEAGALTEARAEVPTGDLVLRNGLDEDLAVTLDGRPRGRVAAAQSLHLPGLLAGRLEVEATGLRSFRRHRVQVVLHADEIREVGLAGAPGTVRVTNDAAEEVEVRIDGSVKHTLPAGHTVELADVAPGPHRLEATGRVTGQAFARDVSLLQGETVGWVLDVRYGLVTLQNDSSERQRVSLDGLEVALLTPFRTLDLPTIARGARTFEAVGQSSGARVRATLDVTAASRALFVVPATGLRLCLGNTLDEPVRVYRDATWLTEVEAGAVRVLDHVPGGPMLLEAVGVRTERVLRHRLEPGDAARVAWEIRVEQGTGTVQNGSGERLKASPELAGQHAEIAPGEAAAFTLPPGRHRLALVGLTSGLGYTRAVEVRAGGAELWAIPRPTGALQIFNRTPEPARLQVEQADAGVVAPGGSILLKDVRAGRVSVVARLQESGQVLRHAPSLQPGGLAHWELERAYARVLVENALGETARLEIDGRVWTQLKPGEARLLDKVLPGSHRFVGIGAASDVRVEATLEVSATRDTRWTLEGTRGVLALANHSGEALAVEIAGRTLGSVPPDVTRRFPVPAGRERLVLRGVTSQRVWRRSVTLQPGRTWDLAVQSLEARFRVTNRLASAVRLGFEGVAVDSLAPGATLEFERPCAHARVELRAVVDRTTHAVTLACRVNEVAEWTIE